MGNHTFYINADNEAWLSSQSNKGGLVNQLIASYRTDGSNLGSVTDISMNISSGSSGPSAIGVPISTPGMVTNQVMPPQAIKVPNNNIFVGLKLCKEHGLYNCGFKHTNQQ